MIELAIMIEGQDGLNWGRWQRLARLVEDLGFIGLYRSDHYTNDRPPDKDSLELWVSLTWLAGNTQRLEFGPLVTPMSFRDPVMSARMATAVDDLSGGRLTFGLGAGWQEREHAHYGLDLLDVAGRFARFTEALEIITHLLNKEKPLTFDGKYYKLREAVLLPRPARQGGPPISIGGNGPKLTLPLTARFAHEWNANFQTPEQFEKLNAQLDELLRQNRRPPGDVRRSMMTRLEFGRDQSEVKRRTAEWGSPAQAHAKGILAGTAGEVVEQLGRLQEAGLQRVMLQWLAMDDLDRLEAFAKSVLPQLK